MIRRRFNTFFVILAVSLLYAAAIQADFSQAQSSDIPFSADPAPGTASYKTGYFVINASPGQAVTETMRLRNDSDAPVRLSVKSVDATTGPYGGISYGLPNEAVNKVGGWITLPASEVELAPRETKDVPITITIPPTAAIGDNVGGIAIWVPRVENQGEPGQGGQSAVIDTQVRRVLSVVVVVPGPAEPLLVITDVKPVVRPDGVYLEIAISNQGKSMTKGEGFIELPDDDFHREFALDTFMPGTSISYPIKWMDNPEENTYPNHVVIQYGEKTAEWWGSFIVGSGLTAQEAAREGNPGNSRYFLYAGLLAALLALIGFFIILNRRKRRREADKELSPEATGSRV